MWSIILALVLGYLVWSTYRWKGTRAAWTYGILTALVAMLFIPAVLDQISNLLSRDAESVSEATSTTAI